jgi:DeoR family fructose operon transcriptional repressor
MPGNDADSLMSSERRRKILETVNARRSVTVLDLADLYPVSAITIRRDLDRLAAEHLIERVHGGAMALAAIAVAPRASEQYERQPNMVKDL